MRMPKELRGKKFKDGTIRKSWMKGKKFAVYMNGGWHHRNGGELTGLLSQTLPVALGAVNPILGAAAGVAVPVVGALTQKKEEVSELPDVNPYSGQTEMATGGKFKQWDAPSHAKGGQVVDRAGIPTNRDMGTAEIEKNENLFKSKDGAYVFSDRLKNPDTGNTFAMDAKKINKKFGDTQDQIAANAYNMAMQNLQRKAEKIRMLAENRKMGNGGKLKKYNPGGPLTSLPPYDNSYNLGLPYQATVPDPRIESLAARPTDTSSFKLPDFGIQQFTNMPASQRTPPKLTGFDAGNILKIGALAGQAVDVFAPSEKEKIRLADFSAGDQAMRGLGVSPQTLTNEISRGEQAASQAARSASRSFGQMAQRLNQIYSTGASKKAQAAQSAKQYNDQVAMQMASREDRKAAADQAEQIRRQTAQSMNDAMRRTGMREFMSNITQLGSSLQQLQYTKDMMKNKNEIARMKARDFLSAMNIVNPNVQIDLDKAMGDLSDLELVELFKVVDTTEKQ